ncbi:MAG: hypothetical protein Q7T05_01105 [Dehalococcoidia bacterium]|nr:hypothetical protein [Dehalococcoidia bacterium]
MNNALAQFTNANDWEQALYAFLAEKHRRSESRRTVETYSRMLQDFFGRIGKQPNEVNSREIFAFAHGPWKQPVASLPEL